MIAGFEIVFLAISLIAVSISLINLLYLKRKRKEETKSLVLNADKNDPWIVPGNSTINSNNHIPVHYGGQTFSPFGNDSMIESNAPNVACYEEKSVYYLAINHASRIVLRNSKYYEYQRGQLYYKLDGSISNPIFLGRSKECDIQIKQCFDQISKIHFSLFCINGQWFIEDYNSANGTFLNGHRLRNKEKQQLTEGDKISIPHQLAFWFVKEKDVKKTDNDGNTGES